MLFDIYSIRRLLKSYVLIRVIALSFPALGLILLQELEMTKIASDYVKITTTSLFFLSFLFIGSQVSILANKNFFPIMIGFVVLCLHLIYFSVISYNKIFLISLIYCAFLIQEPILRSIQEEKLSHFYALKAPLLFSIFFSLFLGNTQEILIVSLSICLISLSVYKSYKKLTFKRLTKHDLNTFLTTFSNYSLHNLDAFIVALISSDFELVVYYISLRVIKVPEVIFISLTHKFTSKNNFHSLKELEDLLKKNKNICFWWILISMIIYFIINNLIDFLEFKFFLLLLISFCLNYFYSGFGFYLVANKKTFKNLLMTIIPAGFLFISYFLLYISNLLSIETIIYSVFLASVFKFYFVRNIYKNEYI